MVLLRSEIVLPEDLVRVERLRLKRDEYQRRLREVWEVGDITKFMHPDLKQQHHAEIGETPEFYSAIIITLLLDQGRVDTYCLSQVLVNQYDIHNFDVDGFNNSAGVIDAYTKGREDELHLNKRGTGLPELRA